MKEIVYDWGGLNVWLFHQINDIHSNALDTCMLGLTAVASHKLFPYYLLILSLIAIVAVIKQPNNPLKNKSLWISTIAVFSIAYLLDGSFVGMLKPMFDFPRPPLALPIETVHIVGEAEYHHSLPSGHSSFAMLIVASIWPVLFFPWQKYLAVIFVLLVGISRVSLGAHFPADVLAGWLSSLVIVLGVRWGIEKIMRYKTFKE